MLEDIIKERRKKLELLEKSGRSAYPATAKRTSRIGEVLNGFDRLVNSRKKIALAGRIMALRDQGKLVFADVADQSGSMQLVLKKENLKDFDLWKNVLDRGDFVAASGSLFITKRGEKSLEVNGLDMISKSLRPLPDTWYGLEDTEKRLRERYLDLIMNPEVKEVFRKKSVFWKSVRDFLLKQNFLEVETSVLEETPGGAEAEPFKTHHNALDADFYLRISLELPLKRLIVGGYEKVFEIGRIFRNEGIDREHLQDYTQMECYWAYADYEGMMALTEKMYKETVKSTMGKLKTTYNGKTIDWSKKWKKLEYTELMKEHAGLDPVKASLGDLRKKAAGLGIEAEKFAGKGRLLDLIYKKTVRPKLIEPCFLVNPPVEVEPLAKRHRENPALVERFQIMAAGTELGKGFSELNDPLDQRSRFEEQMKLRAAGDSEAQRLDEDFLRALEYGMPPTAGFGMSERLFAVLMDKPVRETVFFPLMRRK